MTIGTVKGFSDEIRPKKGKYLFLDTSEKLVERVRREQEITQELARESVNAYAGFLGSLFSYYRASVRTTCEDNLEGHPRSRNKEAGRWHS